MIGRRDFIKQSCLAASAIASGGCSPCLIRDSGRENLIRTDLPNILFVFSDQQRWDTLGCYGQPLPITPNLDKMASEGVRFEHAFTCQPVCGPARACIQTGKYATEVGCFYNSIALPTDETTIAHRLSNVGYEVGYIGKWHLASTTIGKGQHANFRTKAIPPERRGGYRDFWLASDVLEYTSHGYDGHVFDGDMNKVEFKGYRVDCMTDFAIDYLRSRDGTRPFFLFLSYLEPHHQNDHARFEGPEGCKERFADFVVPGDLVGTQGDWQKNYPDYLGCINSLDNNLGRIRRELERQGLADNTLIVYTSDHACHFRTRNKEYKRSCHESSIHVPMILCGPGFRGGKVVEELTSLIDVAPTICAAAGLSKPKEMRGNALHALVDGTATDWPEDVFVQISEATMGRAIRTHKWKYAVDAPKTAKSANGGSDLYVESYLYDLENDPHERTNLVADPAYQDVRAKLSARLVERMLDAGETEPVIEPAPICPPRSRVSQNSYVHFLTTSDSYGFSRVLPETSLKGCVTTAFVARPAPRE